VVHQICIDGFSAPVVSRGKTQCAGNGCSLASALLLCLGLLFCYQSAQAGDRTAKQWLEKMSASMQELNYQGVFIYRRDEELSAMRVTHVVDKKDARELLETLTGEARRELRDTPMAGGDTLPPEKLSKIDHYYSLELHGSDRTAGRPTQLILVNPKDKYRYGYRLWLDQDTGLLLKSDLLDLDGSILEQVMFTSVELLNPDEAAQVMPKEKSHNAPHTGHTDAQQTLSQSEWVIENPPGGFELLETQMVPEHDDGDVLHMVYSDGLASVSVFVERAKQDGDALVGVSRMGAVSAFGRVAGEYQVTVVGEVPEITVKAMGTSIKRKGGAPQ